MLFAGRFTGKILRKLQVIRGNSIVMLEALERISEK